MPSQNRWSIVVAILAFTGLLISCEKPNQYEAPPPPTVTVSPPMQKTVTDYFEFTGNTQATASVDIRARVQGFLQSMSFQEGAIVKQGDLLFIIDPRTYQAAVDKAAADLELKKAELNKAEIEYQRNQRLIKENAASDKDLVNSRAARDSAKAALAASVAALDDAKINLGYTTIKAPLTGRIGRRMVDVGNLVGAGEYTLLTTIKTYDPMYVYFTINENQLLMLHKKYVKERAEALERKSKNEKPEEKVPLQVGLANEEGFPHSGYIDFEDLGVDPTTGTMLLRGILPNPSPYPFLPGLFVRVRAPVGERENALLVTERALGSDQLGSYLLVVNKDNVVEYRPVKVGTLHEGMRVIESGVKPDDLVVVNGIQKARPGAKVTPTRIEATAQGQANSEPTKTSPGKP